MKKTKVLMETTHEIVFHRRREVLASGTRSQIRSAGPVSRKVRGGYHDRLRFSFRLAPSASRAVSCPLCQGLSSQMVIKIHRKCTVEEKSRPFAHPRRRPCFLSNSAHRIPIEPIRPPSQEVQTHHAGDRSSSKHRRISSQDPPAHMRRPETSEKVPR